MGIKRLRREQNVSNTKKIRKNPTSTSASAVRAMVRREVSRARETKIVARHQAEVAMNTIYPSPYLFNYPVPAVGAKEHERVGNKITPTGIACKWLLHNNATSEAIFVRVLMIAIPDGQAANSDIQGAPFEGGSTDAPPVGTLVDIIRKTNREEMKVLKEWIVTLGASQTVTGTQTGHHYVKLGKEDMIFKDQAYQEPVTTRYSLMVMPRESDSDESLGSNVELSYNLDMYYKD